MEQLGVGDAIIITHPVSHAEETKIVRMVLSDVSIGISSPFSADLISTTSFRYIKAPKEVDPDDPDGSKAAARKRMELKRKADAVEEGAFGTYASAGGEKFTYRVKKPGAHGGYTIITETAPKGDGRTGGGPLSREQLLDMRSKKKADRHCY